tara:strand:+ start:288 stop:773 length:486 start_codon:yes stop_codon:yes gene_type:complete
MSYYTLKIDISGLPDDLKKIYEEKIESINVNLNKDSDCGFDLYCVSNQDIYSKSTSNKINLNIKCCMVNDNGNSTGYFLCPRSSLGKTGLRLSNSLGIIDSSYRGNILAYVDNISNNNYKIQKYQRCFQILAPTLNPIKIEIVDSLDITERGINGFGSTGK